MHVHLREVAVGVIYVIMSLCVVADSLGNYTFLHVYI
jgi:hypothetical protein